MKKYGLPYQGSKSKLAEWVLGNLPPATRLYDVFAGGCAVTHAALESGKFEHVHANDIERINNKIILRDEQIDDFYELSSLRDISYMEILRIDKAIFNIDKIRSILGFQF